MLSEAVFVLLVLIVDSAFDGDGDKPCLPDVFCWSSDTTKLMYDFLLSVLVHQTLTMKKMHMCYE